MADWKRKPISKRFRNSLSRKVIKLKSNFLRNTWPKLVDKIIEQANKKNALSLQSKNISILVDTQIFFHAITHETAKIVTGTKKWGNTEIEEFYTARVPIHKKGINHRDYNSIKFLPSIASLAKQGIIELCTSDELRDEQWSQPTPRYRPIGLADYSLLKGVELRHIKDPEYSLSIGGGISIKQQRKNRLENKTDPIYTALLNVLGKRNSQDIWHIVTAERNGCHCFLTMDYKLIENLNAQSNNPHVKTLKTKVMTPLQFGKEFKLTPFSPRLFSFHDAGWPVRADLHFEDSTRPKRNFGKK